MLLGYGDRLSVAAGSTITFMVSSSRSAYDATVVRLIHGDAQPAGPGFKERAVQADVNGMHKGRRQQTRCGSYVRVEGDRLPALTRSWTMHAWVWPTLPCGHGMQAILVRSARGDSLGLFVEDSGELSLRCGSCEAPERVLSSGTAMRARTWYWVAATYDADRGLARLEQVAMTRDADSTTRRTGTSTRSRCTLAVAGPLFFGTADAPFEGKIEAPAVYAAALGPRRLDELRAGRDPLSGPELPLAAWDFSRRVDTDVVVDRGPLAAHGRAVNMPARGVTGHRWTGDCLDFRHAREEYGAIHLHSDDLGDAGWAPSLSWTVPARTPSGVYALRLRARGDEDHIPFVVRPAFAGAGSRSRALLLLPTLTYLAYANERCLAPEQQPERRDDWRVAGEPLDALLAAQPELGRSLYDTHADGSGCCYSSRLRPILNMRPRYRTRLIDAARHFAADLYLVDWLEARGHPYDVATDEDLHHEGLDLLRRYPVVLTGSHPEYCTRAMLDALQGYLNGGGRLMYLGGNGFYWVASIGGEHAHVVEVRRGVAGTRSWTSAPGEAHHSTSGEPGGLWRHRGRPPNHLVGIGFGALGQDGESKGYRRLPDSFDPRVEFIFDGIGPEEVIGDFGLAMGGAAGDELDRVDEQSGSPPGLLRLASAAGFSDFYQVAVEDLQQTTGRAGGTDDARVRADMVYLDVPGGGAVFAVGSMTWSASLSHDGYENNVSRITENVLTRFMQGADARR